MVSENWSAPSMTKSSLGCRDRSVLGMLYCHPEDHHHHTHTHIHTYTWTWWMIGCTLHLATDSTDSRTRGEVLASLPCPLHPHNIRPNGITGLHTHTRTHDAPHRPLCTDIHTFTSSWLAWKEDGTALMSSPLRTS